MHFSDFPWGLRGKESACSVGVARDAGSIPGSGRFSGGGHGNPLQYSCLKNPMDRGAWWATVHGVTKSWTGLSNLACMHAKHFSPIYPYNSFFSLLVSLLQYHLFGAKNAAFHLTGTLCLSLTAMSTGPCIL